MTPIYDVVLRGDWNRTDTEAADLSNPYVTASSRERIRSIDHSLRLWGHDIAEAMESAIGNPGEEPTGPAETVTVSITLSKVSRRWLREQRITGESHDLCGTFEVKAAVYANTQREARKLVVSLLNDAMLDTMCRAPEVKVA